MQPRQRQRFRLVGLASLSAGVALVLIYAARSDRPIAALLLGVFCLILAAANLTMLR